MPGKTKLSIKDLIDGKGSFFESQSAQSDKHYNLLLILGGSNKDAEFIWNYLVNSNRNKKLFEEIGDLEVISNGQIPDFPYKGSKLRVIYLPNQKVLLSNLSITYVFNLNMIDLQY